MNVLRPALILSLALAASQCAPFRQGWDDGWTERAARDRIMLVRTQPETLGHRRITHQAHTHPDLDVFLRSHGLPDFIAETSNDDRQYLILYYLREAVAWAGRSRRILGAPMDFAGPYPLKDSEIRLLADLQIRAEGSR